MVEGTDNNRKDVTGPVVNLPNDSVAEFSVLQTSFPPSWAFFGRLGSAPHPARQQ
jgi:hypothetical protein